MERPTITQSSQLLALPAELLQCILLLALKQQRSIELDELYWSTSWATFCHPLFSVCRSLRDPALEAFYQTNAFICDLSKADQDFRHDRPSALIGPLESPFPSMYPPLYQNLRYLHIRLVLPQEIRESPQDFARWRPPEPEDPHLSYERLVPAVRYLSNSLNHGRKLLHLSIAVQADGPPRGFPPGGFYLAKAHRKALKILFRMEVRGKFHLKLIGMPEKLRNDIEAVHRDTQSKATRHELVTSSH